MILKKGVYFLLIALLFSCKDDDCSDDGDAAFNFTIFLNLETKNGDNFLGNQDLNLDSLTFFDRDFTLQTGEFSMVEKNGINVLELSIINERNIIVELENEQISNFQIQVLETKVDDNCIVQVTDYEARSENGELLCSCVIGEIITVPLDI